MAAPTLTEEIPAAGGNGRRTLAAAPAKEYVAGGVFPWMLGWYASAYRWLPYYIDDLEADFGDDIYHRQLMDPQVASCVRVWKLGILAQPPQVVPAVDDDDPRFEQAKELADFGTRLLAGIPGFCTTFLPDMLDAGMFGHRIAEKVYTEPLASGPDQGRRLLAQVKPKPKGAALFVVDAFLNVLGIAPALRATPNAGIALGSVENLLPRSKFAVLTWCSRNGDPRGTSLGRVAYHPWWFKLQVWPEWLKFLAQTAGASIWGTTPPDASAETKTLPDGSTVYGDDGLAVQISPEEEMLSRLMQLHGGAAAAFPNGTEVNLLQSQSDGSPFNNALDTADRQIAKAILGQTLATEEGEHQARAAASTHQDILGLGFAFGRLWLGEFIRTELLRDAIEINFPAEALELLPLVTLGSVEQEDIAAIGNMIAALEKAGFLTPSQRRGIDVMLGIPPRTPEEVEAAAAAWEKSLTAPPAAPGQPGADPNADPNAPQDGEGDGGDDAAP